MKNDKSEKSQERTAAGNKPKQAHAPVENSAASTSTASGAKSPEDPTSQTPSTLDTENSYASELAEMVSDLQRTRADFENFRKQVDLQKNQAMAAARFATVQKFLPLIDDFSRAIEVYPDQLAPLAKNFQKLLQSLQLSPIDSAPGTDFNPDLHEAISMEDGDGTREVILETLRPGYFYENSVIRPAMVKVIRQK